MKKLQGPNLRLYETQWFNQSLKPYAYDNLIKVYLVEPAPPPTPTKEIINYTYHQRSVIFI